MDLPMRKDVPVELTWDLSLIYPSEEEMQQDADAAKALAAEIVETYKGKLTDADSNINTNNTLIDAIINTKYREMEEQGILLVMKFNEMADLWMDDEDVVVILSNLLNNAIEACEKCEEKTVKMKLMKESDDIIISVRNTYNGEIVMKGDEIQTSKSDKAEHGLGIKNVIEAVEKYGGSYSINHDEKEFAFSICIPKA